MQKLMGKWGAFFAMVLALVSLLACPVFALPSVSKAQDKIPEIYRLSELYQMDLFGPDTWIFLDLDETLLENKNGRETPLDPDFINLIKHYSDPDTRQSPRATKFFILTARNTQEHAKSSIRTIGLDPDQNFAEIVLSPGDLTKGETLVRFLQTKFQDPHMPRPKRIIFVDDLKEHLQSVEKTFSEEKFNPAFKDIKLKLFHITARTAHQEVRQAAGVFLYMKCPHSPQQMCAVLIDRNYGGNANTFSNPGGLVDPGETTELAAAREATEELGEIIKLTPQDLHISRQFPNALMKGVAKNTSDAGFDSVEYHMYFKQVPTMTASEILGHMKAYKGHGAGESHAVAIVPLDDLRAAVDGNGVIGIQALGGQLYAHETGMVLDAATIQLYPQMVALLRQPLPNGKTILDLLGEHIDLTVPFGFSALSGKTPSAELAEKQTALTITRKAQLAGEFTNGMRKAKTMFAPTDRTYSESQEALAALPYTSSGAYLKLMMGADYDLHQSNLAELITLFFDKPYTTFEDTTPFKDPIFRHILAGILMEEKKHAGWYVFYHGTDPKLAFMYDILSTYRSRFQAIHGQDNPRLRFLDSPFIGLENMDEFIAFFSGSAGKGTNISDYIKNFSNPSFKGGVLGPKNYQDMALSVNLSPFGSDGLIKDSTIEFFATGTTNNPPDCKSLFDTVRAEIGFSKTWEDFHPLFEEYERNFGRVYQIFIHPDYVDELSRLSDAAGDPLFINVGEGNRSAKITTTIPLLRNNPADFLKGWIQLSDVQARLFLKPERFSNPEIVQIRVYDNKPVDQRQEQAFWKKLDAMVTEDVTHWILKKKKMTEGAMGDRELPLQKMANHVYKSEAAMAYERQDPIQGKMHELFNLLKKRDVDGVRKFIKSNPTYPINTPLKKIDYYNPDNSYEMPPLLFVAGEVADHKEELIKLLVEAKADVNAVNENGRTILDFAIEKGMGNLSIFLINQPSLDILHKDASGNTYLHDAVGGNNEFLAKALVEKGADVNAINRDKKTILGLAIEKGMENFAIFLLSRPSIDIFHKDASENTYLHDAVRKKMGLLVKALIEKGADVKAINTNGQTILDLAINFGAEDLAIFLTNLPSTDIFHKDANNDTYLHTAVSKTMPLLAKALVEKGADVKATNLGGNTPLHVAAKSDLNNIGLGSILLEKGALLQVQNKEGKTPLKIAAETGNLGFIKNALTYLNPQIQIDQQVISQELSSIRFDLYKYTPQEIQTFLETSGIANVIYEATFAVKDVNNILNICAKLPQLTSLVIESRLMGIVGATTIVNSPQIPLLTSLNLGGNNIGAAGAMAIASSPRMSNLTSLNLWGNNLGAAGAKAIATSTNMQNLTSLDLQRNTIGDEGAVAIATSTNMQNLTSLNLWNNNISDTMKQELKKRFPFVKL